MQHYELIFSLSSKVNGMKVNSTAYCQSERTYLLLDIIAHQLLAASAAL